MTTDNTTKKRHTEFDIARGVAIFLMISQHSWYLIFKHFTSSPYIENTIYILGIVLGAPVFLFLMGLNTLNSHHSEPRQLFIRGVKIFFLGYLLSALRFFLPIILGQYLGIINNPENIIYHWQPIYYLLEVDIFQLAGLSLIVLSFLKWKQIKYKYYLLIALIVIFVSPFFWQINNSGFLKYILDIFWGTDAYVVFPLFSCLFYPLVGAYFGSLLSKAKDKTIFYKDCLIKGIPIFILGLLFLFINPDFSQTSYYRHNISLGLIFISTIIYYLAFINFNYKKLPIKITNTLTTWSKNVTLIYIVQWLIIAWIAILINLK